MTANLKYFALVALTALVAVFGRPSQTNAQVLLRKEQPDLTITSAMRTEVIEGVIKGLNDAYVLPDVAKTMETAIRDRLAKKEYDNITSAAKLTDKLTEDLRAVSHDKHLRVFSVTIHSQPRLRNAARRALRSGSGFAVPAPCRTSALRKSNACPATSATSICVDSMRRSWPAIRQPPQWGFWRTPTR